MIYTHVLNKGTIEQPQRLCVFAALWRELRVEQLPRPVATSWHNGHFDRFAGAHGFQSLTDFTQRQSVRD